MICKYSHFPIYFLHESDNLVQKIRRWRHTGFNVHTDVRPTSKDETESMVSYQYGKGKEAENPFLIIKQEEPFEKLSKRSRMWPCGHRHYPLHLQL